MADGLLTQNNILVGVVILLALQAFGYIGSPAESPMGDGTSIIVPPEDVTATLYAVDKYQTGTARTTEYAKIYIQDDGKWFDSGLVSLNKGTFESDANTLVRMYGAENSSTYYTQKREEKLPAAKGQPKYQFDLITIDTSPTLTFYNDDSDSNTAQAIAASSTKTVSIRYEATTYKGVGNPQCKTEGGKDPLTICIEYNTTAYTGVQMPELQSASIPTRIAAFGNASFGYKCYGAVGVYNGGDQRYKVVITSGTPDPLGSAGNYLYVYYEDCDFDVNQKTSAEIWGTEDEDNNNLGSTTQIADVITVS